MTVSFYQKFLLPWGQFAPEELTRQLFEKDRRWIGRWP